MADNKLKNPEELEFRLSAGDPRSCEVIIIKVADRYADRYTVKVSLQDDGRTRALAESIVDSYSDAEEVAKAFASQLEFPWYKVAVMSR